MLEWIDIDCNHLRIISMTSIGMLTSWVLSVIPLCDDFWTYVCASDEHIVETEQIKLPRTSCKNSCHHEYCRDGQKCCTGDPEFFRAISYRCLTCLLGYSLGIWQVSFQRNVVDQCLPKASVVEQFARPHSIATSQSSSLAQRHEISKSVQDVRCRFWEIHCTCSC